MDAEPDRAKPQCGGSQEKVLCGRGAILHPRAGRDLSITADRDAEGSLEEHFSVWMNPSQIVKDSAFCHDDEVPRLAI